MKTSIDFCKEFNPCCVGESFALRYVTMREVWDACPRADWLLWILDKIDTRLDQNRLREFTYWCIKNTPLEDGQTPWNLLTDQGKNAVEVAERFARGEATKKEFGAAVEDAYDAYSASSRAATAAATTAATNAVHYLDPATTAEADAAHYFDTASKAAAHTAAVAYTAYAYVANAATSAAEHSIAIATEGSAKKAQADYFRTLIPNPFL